MSSQPAISGYSCQAALSLRVAHLINGGKLDWWLAREFYPVANDRSSQPIQIYAWLHQAKSTGRPNRKTKRLQARLLNWLNTWRDEGLAGTRAYEAAYLAITQAFESGAKMPIFFYLDQVAKYSVESEPDEYRAWRADQQQECASGVAAPVRIDTRGSKRVAGDWLVILQREIRPFERRGFCRYA